MVLSVLIGLLAAVPAVAKKDKGEYMERFLARGYTIASAAGGTSIVEIGIKRWSTDEERTALLTALADGGSQALAGALGKQDDLGFIRFDTGRQTLRYAREYLAPDGQGRVIMLATDRPVGLVEWAERFRTMQYTVSIVELQLNAKDKGEGTIIAGAEVKLNKEEGTLNIENYAVQPIRLTSVRPK